jgi:two-component system response regulator HydG
MVDQLGAPGAAQCGSSDGSDADEPFNMKVLLVDDHALARRALERCLAPRAGVEIYEAASLSAARQILSRTPIEVALIDVRLDEHDPANRDGMTLVQELRQSGATVPIVVTASSQMTEIRNAMRAGAYTYILKDELCEELVLPVLDDLQRRRALEHQVLHLHGLVGASPPMERLRRLIKRVATADTPVLVLGPTGSGKELVARAIHALSPRRDQPLVSVNCGAFTDTLVEAQLFGHEKGTYTGADKARDGYLAEARRGTLFLDEIAELPLLLQTKLLRVLESRTYRSLGASTDSRFEGRLIAATHVDLSSRVEAGRFRQDLYYRLEVLTVRVPALDERKEDIPALVEHLSREAPRQLHYSEEALAALMQRNWPGNVRQLRNFVHRLSVLVEHNSVTKVDIEAHQVHDEPRSAEPIRPSASEAEEFLRGVSPTQSRRENTLLLTQNQIRILEARGHAVDAICRILGIGRSTLFRVKAGDE